MKNFEQEDQEMMKFSWTGLFTVTSCCFFLFSIVIRILEGEHVLAFLKIGSVCMVLASIAYMIKQSNTNGESSSIKKKSENNTSLFL